MILINFSHPLTPDHLQRIAELTGRRVEKVIDLPVQFDNDAPFQPQLQQIMEALDLSAETLQTASILVNLPSLNFIAALVLAELHGRMGYFPPILRLRPIAGSLPPQFEIAETLNLQQLRDAARKTRYR